VAFVVGDAAKAANELPDETRREAVLAELARFFGPEAARPLAYVDRSWLAEEWSEGCYAGLMGPGVMTAAGETLRAPAGRLHFAGTEAATRWAGYIEGAIESGERAADEVARLVRASGPA
jgi:monoamine oxidase